MQSSNSLAHDLEQWQFVLGEGPSIEVIACGFPLDAVDIAGVTRAPWPFFGERLSAAGQRSVFAQPLLIDGTCSGVLTLYRRDIAPTNEASRRAVARCATAVTTVLLAGDTDFEPFDRLHRATGVVMAALRVDAEEAAIRIRAHAYVVHQPLMGTVADILSGRLQLDR